jgi:hypothetical protein
MRYLHQREPHARYIKRKNDIQVFENLCEPETWHVVKLSQGCIIRIHEPRESMLDCQVFVDTGDCACCAMEVLGIPRHAVSVEVRFKDFWTQDIAGPGDVESVFLVERKLFWAGWVVPCEVTTIRRDEGKRFWAKSGSRWMID